MALEQIQITGNIGQDASIKEFNGNQYGSFTVAVNKSYKNKEGVKVEKTNWYNVLTAEIKRVPWLKSGAKVFVQGDFSSGIYRDKKGEYRISLDIAARLIDIQVFAKDETEDQQTDVSAATGNPTGTIGEGLDEDGLPF